MSYGLESLHKILKDETRRRILRLIDERELTYTDLMNELENVSTGLLNYHLKVINDLLVKNGEGKYTLTDKGKLAVQLLKQFPLDNNGVRAKRQKQLWIFAASIQVVYLVSVIALYYLNYFNLGRLIIYILWFAGGMGLAYLAYRVQDKAPLPGSTEEKKRLRRAYPMIGGLLGLIIGFISPIILIVLVMLVGGPNLAYYAGSGDLAIGLLVFGTIIGTIIGYWIGKRRDFRRPNWF